MKIIEATKNQLPIIKELAYKIWPKAYVETNIISLHQMNFMLENFYSISSLEKQYNSNHVFLIAQEENTYLGFASYEINCGEKGKTKLHKIYVLPEIQGKGVGIKLINEIENRLQKVNNYALFLNVNKHNLAKNFYEKLGFTTTKEEVIDIGQGYVMDDYVMEKIYS